jgi:type II secretory pathway pseudopilin PulG
MPKSTNADGFSLIEALMAAALLAGTITVLAQLVTRSVDQLWRSDRVVLATTLAQAKLEQLRAAAFAFDETGVRVDDALLAPSAADALVQDSPPHVEALGRFGELLPAGIEPVYIRRWSIAAAPLDADTLTLSACVRPAAGDAPLIEACVWTTRTRQP